MEKYYPPVGFQKDEASGLYYQSTMVTDEQGRQVQVVVWFNAETGEYTQYEYSQEVVQEVAAEPIKQAEIKQPQVKQPQVKQPQVSPDSWIPKVPPESISKSMMQRPKKKGKYVVGIVIVLLLLCGGIVAYLIKTDQFPYFQNEQKDETMKAESLKKEEEEKVADEEVEPQVNPYTLEIEITGSKTATIKLSGVNVDTTIDKARWEIGFDEEYEVGLKVYNGGNVQCDTTVRIYNEDGGYDKPVLSLCNYEVEGNSITFYADFSKTVNLDRADVVDIADTSKFTTVEISVDETGTDCNSITLPLADVLVSNIAQ